MGDVWPRETIADLNHFYGNCGSGPEADAVWEGKNLVMWEPPYPMIYSDMHTKLPHLRIHRACVAAFDEAFKDVRDTLGQSYIVGKRLNVTGGTYNHRLKRGGHTLSVHSWGCAIDMDPSHNPFPSAWRKDSMWIDRKFADILMKHGFCWRGFEGDNDPMHFQLARHRWSV